MSRSAVVVQRNNKFATQDEWLSISPSVRNMAVDIAINIREAHEKIAKAKELAENAPNIKGKFLGLGKQKKVNEALAEAQVVTNEAVFDLSELIQQSIKLTLHSAKMARDMQRALAYLAINGITDANGRIETLSRECTESIDTIIEHAQDFIMQQEKIENRQSELNNRIEDQKVKYREQDKALKDMEKTISVYFESSKRLEQRLVDLQKIVYENQTEEEINRKKLELMVGNNITSIENLKETLLENQRINEEQIKEIERELREIIEINKQLEEEERNRLKEEYHADLLKLKKNFMIICGVIGAIAVVALIF